jgi:predicted lipoprotein with Yx(FWY)xxD motif
MKAITIACLAVGALFVAQAAYAKAKWPADIAVQKTDAGTFITNTFGFTLYTYDGDASSPGRSTCKDACAKAWPPHLASPNAKADGDWSLIKRETGELQWAFRGLPLYSNIRDVRPGTTVGDGEESVWRVAFQPSYTPMQIGVANNAILGYILVTSRGMTLYARDGDVAKDGKPGCTAECLQQWSPLPAAALARNKDDWSTVDRGDGTRQWAYKGRPLYTSKRDVIATHIRGHSVNKWQAVVLQPAPALPPWATIQNSDMGAVFAAKDGKTVYAFIGDIDKLKPISCDDVCIRKNWIPVPAAASDKPTGNWDIIRNEDGSLQWTHKGGAIFTFARDYKPGDIFGDKFAHGHGKHSLTGGWWRPILQSCLCSPPQT